MKDILLYFRKKLTQDSFSSLLTDEQLYTILNEKFKNKQLTNSFINKPLEVLEIKIKILNSAPFYKEETSYLKSLIDSYQNTKLFNIQDLMKLAIKIEDLTLYVNDLYSKNTQKKNLFSQLKPLIDQIENVFNDDIDGFLKKELELINTKLSSILDGKSFNLEEIENLIKYTNLLLVEFNNQKRKKSDDLREENLTKKRNKIKKITLAFASLVFAFSSYKIYLWQKDNYNINKEMKEIKEVVNIEYTDNSSKYRNYIFDINFNELITKNEETKGYIKVKGTNIDYPFVQASDNNYYLSHSFSREYNDAGWIFLDYRNNFDELDYNTIIYGHGRLDGSMFGSLKNTLDNTWYENNENHIITTISNNKIYLWQVFSTYTIKTETYYLKTTFKDYREQIEFIETLKERSLYDFNIDLTLNDRILTLSTCYNDEKRVVVHAKLIYEK